MIQDLGNILAWALCGGILLAVVGIWLYIYARLLWFAITKGPRSR